MLTLQACRTNHVDPTGVSAFRNPAATAKAMQKLFWPLATDTDDDRTRPSAIGL